MSFIYRLGIAVALAAALPVLVVNYSYAAAYETHLLFTYGVFWFFFAALSLYSSPVVPVQQDALGKPMSAYLRRAKLRQQVGNIVVFGSIAVALSFSFVATYSFMEKYEFIVLGPVGAVLPIGAYLRLTPMCPYCKKLNKVGLRECENCANALLPDFLHKKPA